MGTVDGRGYDGQHELFVMLVGHALNSRHTEASFSLISIDLLALITRSGA